MLPRLLPPAAPDKRQAGAHLGPTWDAWGCRCGSSRKCDVLLPGGKRAGARVVGTGQLAGGAAGEQGGMVEIGGGHAACAQLCAVICQGLAWRQVGGFSCSVVRTPALVWGARPMGSWTWVVRNDAQASHSAGQVWQGCECPDCLAAPQHVLGVVRRLKPASGSPELHRCAMLKRAGDKQESQHDSGYQMLWVFRA